MGRSNLKRRRARALVLRQPPRKDSRSLQRFGLCMLFGVLLLGIYGQYAGRGPGDSRPVLRQQAPVVHFETRVVRAPSRDTDDTPAAGEAFDNRGRLHF
jgi:hypothetical protein